MIETRTALARLFVLLAIITIPTGMMHRYSELFRLSLKCQGQDLKTYPSEDHAPKGISQTQSRYPSCPVPR
jgi:hypothetical protein